MGQLTGQPTIGINDTDLYTNGGTTAPSGYGIGQWNAGVNGKVFRFGLVGVSNLVAGNLLQNSADDTTYTNMAVGTAAVAGDAYIQVTNGTATITNEQFIGGTIAVYTAGTVPVGDEYTIIGVTGTFTSGGALQVFTDRPLRYAFTTSAKVTMRRSPWSGMIQFPVTTQTGIPVGIAIYALTAANYGWVQSHGTCSMLSDNSTFAIGSMVSPSLAVAGAVGVNVAGTTHGTVGWSINAAASTHAIPGFLMID